MFDQTVESKTTGWKDKFVQKNKTKKNKKKTTSYRIRRIFSDWFSASGLALWGNYFCELSFFC